MPNPRVSNGSSSFSGGRQRKPRCKSASEIARDVRSFETWATYQGCVDVAYDDIPKDLKKGIKKVFKTVRQLPREWLDESSDAYKHMSCVISPSFMTFIKGIHKKAPTMFTKKASADDGKELLFDLYNVFTAWTRLQKMQNSSRKWTEADYVANIYNVFRSPAVREGDYRAQWPITLPQPLPRFPIAAKSLRILNAKTASPDSAIYIPSRLVRHLSHGADSPYKLLNTCSSVTKDGSVGGESSFRYQATPCTKLPDTPGFEFVSTFWEDKKPVHQMLEDAYRQNKMATTSAVRQLHALHVQAPIFGLVWARGTVRAHVDWWDEDPTTGELTIRSAAYPGSTTRDRRTSGIFNEWDLHEPCDIVQVFLLIRNLDRWTVGGFRERVEKGIQQLVSDVVDDGQRLAPWKRKGDLAHLIPRQDEGGRPSFSVTVSNSPPPMRRRTRKRGQS